MFFPITRTFFSHSRLEQFGNNIPFFTTTQRFFSILPKKHIESYHEKNYLFQTIFVFCSLNDEWHELLRLIGGQNQIRSPVSIGNYYPWLRHLKSEFRMYIRTFVHFSDLVKMLPICFFFYDGLFKITYNGTLFLIKYFKMQMQGLNG